MQDEAFPSARARTRRPADATHGVGTSPPAANVAQMVARAGHLLAEGGGDALSRFLDRRPEHAITLAQLSDSDLRDGLAAALERERGSGALGLGVGNSLSALAATGRIRQAAHATLRASIRSEVVRRLDEIIEAVETQRADPSIIAAALASQPGRPATEVTSTTELLEISVARLRDLRSHLFGQTWEPTDFPAITDRVLPRLGVSRVPVDSVLDELVQGPRRSRFRVGHDASLALDVGHLALDTLHAPAVYAESGAAAVAAPLAVALAGVALGAAISDGVEDNIEARRALARQLGL